MKIKVDSSLSNDKEFYGTIFPESDEEVDKLRDLIVLNETVKITALTGAKK